MPKRFANKISTWTLVLVLTFLNSTIMLKQFIHHGLDHAWTDKWDCKSSQK